jgi:hypothetical protein
MVLPALTHERPLRAYAPRGRRKTGDAQSRLRASPVTDCNVALAQQRPANSSERAENRVPYSLLTIGYSLKKLLEQRALCRPGGYGGAAAPDPIPNSAVKRSSADGTSSQDAGE